MLVCTPGWAAARRCHRPAEDAIAAAADPFEETRPEQPTGRGTKSQPDGAVVPGWLDVARRAWRGALADLDASRGDEPQIAQRRRFGAHPELRAARPAYPAGWFDDAGTTAPEPIDEEPVVDLVGGEGGPGV